MMLCGCCGGGGGGAFTSRIHTLVRDYDRIQSWAVFLIYIQIGCALIGSVGAFYNGVLVMNLVIALFALVAIESSSQSLGRTYALLLLCAILLDVFWFFLFASDISNISTEIYGNFVVFSVKLTLSMEIIGFVVRLSSSLLWIQMYRLGVSYSDNSFPREADADLRNSFLNPATPSIIRDASGSDEVLGGSIYDPAHYSSLFEDGKDDRYLHGGDQNPGVMVGSASNPEICQLKPSIVNSFRTRDASDYFLLTLATAVLVMLYKHQKSFE